MVSFEAASPPKIFTHPLVRMDSDLLGFFSFTRCIPNTLDIFLRQLLRRFRSGKIQGVRSWGFLRCLLSERAARVSPPKFLRGICSSCRSFYCFRLSGGVLWVCSRPLFPVYCGDSTEFLYGLPCDCKRCPRKYCPCLLLASSLGEEGLIGLSSFLPDGLF